MILTRNPKYEERDDLSIIQFSEAFVNTLGEYSDQAGMELKREETWSSTVRFEYSKRYHLYRVPVSNALKRASKIVTETNSGLPTFSNIISSIFLGGVTVAGVDSPAYILACFEAAFAFT